MSDAFEQCRNVAAQSFWDAPEVIFDIADQSWEGYSVSYAAQFAVGHMSPEERSRLIAEYAELSSDDGPIGEMAAMRVAYDSLVSRITNSLTVNPDIQQRMLSNRHKAGLMNAAPLN